MPVVVSVKFPYASHDLWFDPGAVSLEVGDYAICSTERGTEIGLVVAAAFEVPESELKAPLKPVLRVADARDLDQADRLACQGDQAMADFRELVKQNELEMKPVAVEFLFGGEKAVFYFAAEDRVDFRQLVKDLSSRFKVRVDMRQIGVRDETRLVGGYAHCGQELCCKRFGGQFEPVSIRMAKEQDLPLNSAKISGMCGRLMCCLRYEFEAYKDFKNRAPKKKTLIDTPLGKARIQEYDTPREQLVLRLESGKVFRVNLSDMSCSEGCAQHGKEQGCSCRPDCVSRDVLERIESPEVKLALLELDREHGVDVGDGLDQSDRIIATGPTPRRKRQREEEAAKFAAAGKERPRRSRKPAGGAVLSPERLAPNETPQEGAGAQPQRRRRRRMNADQRNDAFRSAARAAQQTSEQPTERSRRRRHSTAPGASIRPEVPSVAEQLADGNVKVSRRRPGDGGGQTAAEQAPERRRRRRTHKSKSDGPSSATSDA